MVGLTSLWLPILVSAVLIFFVSFAVHAVLKYHNTDFDRLPNEGAVRETLKDVAPGQYSFPRPEDPKQVGSKEHMEAAKVPPAGFLTLMDTSKSMGMRLGLWFVYTLIVGVFVAYVTGRTFAGGADYLAVFRIAGVTAILAYSAANIPMAIWFDYKWSSTFKSVLDGVIYGLITAGVFGWLWPA